MVIHFYIILFIAFSTYISDVICQKNYVSDIKEAIASSNKDLIYLNITQLIIRNNFPVEEYEVVTPDGYKLKIFRIPGNGSVVFLMHGVISSADDWITGGVDSGLGYLLAEQGYDVWMGNARGNKHSKSNIHISPSQKEFYDFSFHEIGVIDLPTMIDFVLEKTKKSSLIYIGHSQGTATFFVMCSLRPEYNAKIDLMIALAPIAWLSHVRSPLINFLKIFYSEIEFALKSFGIYELLQDTALLRKLQKTFCGDVASAFLICEHLTFLVGGINYGQINYKNLPVIFNHFPAGSSDKQFVHYAQLIRSGFFRQYDYGSIKNVAKYGSLSPPSYPVEKVTAPVALFYGGGDWLSTSKDVKVLKRRLPNLVDFYKVNDKNFNHFDFIYGVNSKIILLPNIIKHIKLIS